MKIYKNESFKILKPESIKDFDDIALIFESISKNYKNILHYHFQLQERVEDRIWSDVYMKAETIAANCECDERTVHRLHKDLSAIIFKKKRYKNGKQTSNVYKMHKLFYQFMKAFRRLGLWKEGVNFKERWKWIKELWLKSGCDTGQFINNVYNYKSNKNKGLSIGCKQGGKNLSVSDIPKCQSSFLPLSEAMKICTNWVPSEKLKEIESFIMRKVRWAMEDMKWYVLEKHKTIYSYTGFFADALKRSLNPKKV